LPWPLLGRVEAHVFGVDVNLVDKLILVSEQDVIAPRDSNLTNRESAPFLRDSIGGAREDTDREEADSGEHRDANAQSQYPGTGLYLALRKYLSTSAHHIRMLITTRCASGLIPTLVCVLSPTAASSESFSVTGLADVGLVVPSDHRSWVQGGFGKFAWANDIQQPIPIGQAVTDLRAELDPSLAGFATVRLASGQHVPLDVLEAYARYQPISTRDWLWSLKVGAFFPPISLENESTGWTSPWTLTPSAINSWVGDELRTIGVESTVEWRYGSGTLGVQGAVFGLNEPAGALLADRGWAFDDRPAGLLGEPQIADALAQTFGKPTPLREQPFQQIDHQLGWYGGASLRQDGLGRAAVLYYDNRANPSAKAGSDFAWRTKFTSLGLESDIGDVVLLSQVMFGQTAIAPAANFSSATDFQSAYLLVGYYFGDFRIAGRADLFATQQHDNGRGGAIGEHGYALTMAGTWVPIRWLRLTTEIMRIESYRSAALTPGSGTNNSAVQLQLVARISF
jgi:hypothetical protein